MLLHYHPLFRIYFGDARDKLFPQDFLHLPPNKNILKVKPFAHLKKNLGIESLIFLHQVHGAEGIVIKSEDEAKQIQPFAQDGDFIITSVKKVGIGVTTADCLPVVFFDKKNQVIAIAHAGWKGSAKHILGKVIDKMKQEFATNLDDLKVFFGPSAKVCCYTVNQEFLEHFEDIEFLDRVIQRRGEALYFDLPLFNNIVLQDLGIKKEQISDQYNNCTVCDDSFFSYRRQGEYGGRQMTVACLI